jgi:hypothetical protein
MKSKFTLLLLCVFVSFLSAQQITRGPYLQSLTSNTIKVCWRTDSVTNGRVYYGSSMTSMTNYIDDATTTANHRVKITGLLPFTKYYYKVGTSTQALNGPDTLQHFTTAPLPGTSQPIRLWCIGDFGKASVAQGLVRDSYLAYERGKHTDLWLWVGDNAYQDGTDAEFQEKVFDSITGYYRLFKYMPFMPAPGNHDYNSISPVPGNIDPAIHTGPYLDIIDPPTEGEAGGVPSHTKLYYSYDYGNAHFVSLNSELGSTTPAYDYTGAFTANFTSSPMTTWLEADLAATDKQWIIVYWHQLPYSSGDVFSDDFWQYYMIAMRKNINPIIERYGADLVLVGHDHDYQRTYLINGHYGNSSTFTAANLINGSTGNSAFGQPYIKDTIGGIANKGTVYVCSGNAGAGNPPGHDPHPAIFYGEDCDTCIGSFIVEIDGGKLEGKYLRASGVIADNFTIYKGIPSGINPNEIVQASISVMPNPFNRTARIKYVLPANTDYTLDIFDLFGKKVSTLKEGNSENGDFLYATLDSDKMQLNNGIYFLRLNVGGKSVTKQIIRVE